MLSNALDCKHNVDLLIRTGRTIDFQTFCFGKRRIQSFFTDTLWPDFTTEELEKILKDFTKIERRLGD